MYIHPNTVLEVMCQSALIRHKGSPSSSRFRSASNSTGLALVSLAKSAVATQGRSGPVLFAYSCAKLCKRLQQWNSKTWRNHGSQQGMSENHSELSEPHASSLQDKMAQKNMAMRVLQGPTALATAWFDYFRQVLSSRPRCPLCQLILSIALCYALLRAWGHLVIQLCPSVPIGQVIHWSFMIFLFRHQAEGADAAAQSREIWTDRLDRTKVLRLCGRWFQRQHRLRLAEHLQQRLKDIPSAAGEWSLLSTLETHHVTSVFQYK